MLSKARQVVTIDSSKKSSRNLARFLFLGALLLLLLWLVLKTWYVAQATRSLLARQTQAELLLADGISNISPDEAEALALGVRQDVLRLTNEVRPFMPLLPYLNWLPGIGPSLEAAPHLLAMADAGTEAAAYAARGLTPGLAVLQEEGELSDSRVAVLVAVLDTAQPDLAQASLAMERVAAARANIGNAAALPGRVQTLLVQADEWLPLAQDGLKLAQHLPAMMGNEGRRHYLLVAQNEDELRATGGFFTGVGLLVVEAGRIVDLTFQDAYTIDNWQEKPYDLPPQPLQELMLSDLFLFRDANFWPDFPTSAEKAMALYSYGQDFDHLDGLIAFDQHFVQLLVAATGPVYIPEADATINSQNIIESFREAWAVKEGQTYSNWFRSRKEFLGTFAAAIRTRLESEFSKIDPIFLVRNLDKALQGRHLQIYVRDPAIASVLDELDWDGRLVAPADQDVLLVVDTNMGFNKTNIFIDREITYDVTLAKDSDVEANLSVHYTHTGSDNGQACLQGVVYDQNLSNYLQIADECYWSYLRIYTPEHSEIVNSSRHVVPGETLVSGRTWDSTAVTLNELPGFTTFANFIMVSQDESLSSTYHYRLPDNVVRRGDDFNQYWLTIVKQAGALPGPFHLTVTLPPNARLIEASPAPAKVDGTRLYFEINLDRDATVSVKYRP